MVISKRSGLTKQKIALMFLSVVTYACYQSVECSELADKALSKATWIFDNTRQNHYDHTPGSAKKQVEVEEGNVTTETDCSGFISYVLTTVARKHYEEVLDFNGGRRPRADNYAQFFAQLSSQPRNGWLAINSVTELQPGDIIAWESPHYEKYHEGNTGHVMMVLEQPGSIKEETVNGKKIRFVGIPVIDSSSVCHFSPETLPPLTHQDRRDGVGKGTVRLVLDDRNKPIAYWEGTYWGEGQKQITKPTPSQIIYFARLIGFKEQ
jgi:cell wall-associated NlpC family hydrolase